MTSTRDGELHARVDWWKSVLEAMTRVHGDGPEVEPRGDAWLTRYQTYRSLRVARDEDQELALLPSLRDEPIALTASWLCGSDDDGRWTELPAADLVDAEGGGTFALFERLARAIDDGTMPVLERWGDVLVVPVIGLSVAPRSARLHDRALSEIARLRTRSVVIDLGGVTTLDSGAAQRLVFFLFALDALGARVTLSGSQPAVADALVTAGIDVSELETTRGLREAVARSRVRRDTPTVRAPGRPR